MLPTPECISESAARVFELTLGLPVVAGPIEVDEQSKQLVACIGIQGTWHGALTLQVDETLAKLAASAMFLIDELETGPSEITDALGELANQLAGNLKGVLAEGASMGLPTVTQGADWRLTVVGSRPVAEAVLHSNGHPLRVVLHERQG
jgi:chemotaxis protein CheX